MIWQLDRPQPALPASYFWTWDHSTNWVLDDPGNVTFGCANPYLKRPETYLEDYRRLTDFSAGLGVKGVLIWGFLRDSHGGIDAGKRVADYAAERGVAIMPGVGTTHYGGIYYEGDHPYCIDTFLREHPEAAMLDEEGHRISHSTCPSSPAFLEWLAEGLDWLYKEFAIGGINLENGDFMVCHCPQCKAHQASWPAGDPDFFRLQAMSYLPALRAVTDRMDGLVTWATYTGFLPEDPKPVNHMTGSMLCRRPAIIDRVPDGAITQWTLTGMVRQRDAEDAAIRPLPLLAYLDDGAPEAALDIPQWPRDLKPLGPRSVGFLHQGSQWTGHRYEMVVSTIKEGCLRAYRAGLEGVSIHGEISPRCVPWALNYLAFSHFIHWPEDSLREFGRKTLGQIFDSEADGDAYAELLAHVESGSMAEAQRKELEQRAGQAARMLSTYRGNDPEAATTRWQLWDWLWVTSRGPQWRQVQNWF